MRRMVPVLLVLHEPLVIVRVLWRCAAANRDGVHAACEVRVCRGEKGVWRGGQRTVRQGCAR